MTAAPEATTVPENYPMQSPALVREMVTVSHGNLKRVRELVEARPALSKATVDWGFGDWESALGAASHTGSREIAELLIANGARPTLFSAAMLGHLDVVKAFIAAHPGAQRIPGPHSIGLLAHAKAGGAAANAVREYLESLGDADRPPTVALSDEELKALEGTYVFGPGATEHIEVKANRGILLFTRQGTVSRPLFHTGDRVFYPAGARSVKIRFADGVLTVQDPEVELTARKTG